jgi:hypothetical protein
MSLSNPQKSLIKRAQRECGLDDAEYRDALEIVSGCRSSTSPTLTDRHVDTLMSYLEAIFWRKVDAGHVQPSSSVTAVFRQRNYWRLKNTRQETSRDRFTGRNLKQEIADLEGQLQARGFSEKYCAGIRANTTHGRDDAHALYLYRAALDRTLQSKQRQAKQFSG